jgi:hypothetical protein
MAARQLIAVAAAVVVAATATGCGGDGENSAFAPARQKQMDSYAASRRAKVEKLVKDGALPRQALQVIGVDGTANANFIDGPDFDHDVVHTGAGGLSGKKLVWDLNQDGKIQKAERTITERDLYEATLVGN